METLLEGLLVLAIILTPLILGGIWEQLKTKI